MHELSVASAILETVRRHADGRQVTLVSMRVGRMRQVVPGSLRFYWEIVARGTICEGATLELEQTEARLRCSGCGREWEPLVASFRCTDCAAAKVLVVSGEELEIDHIEVEEPPALTARQGGTACIEPG